MATRVDMTLEWHLRAVSEECADAEVREALDAVFAHMHSGRSTKRRGGKELIRLLTEARSQAARAEEWEVVRQVHDAVAYAEGRILRHDFEERYRLFQDGARNDINRDFLGRTMWAAHHWMVSTGREYLKAHPEATAEDVLEHFRAEGEDARFLEAPADRPGRYVIPRGRAETALWLERILRDGRIDIEDPAEAARTIVTSPEALALLAADEQGHLVLQATELRRRAAGLEELRQVIEDREAHERELQRVLEGQHWIFGGQYVGEAAQRRLVPGDEVDIPLIRGDGALHVVELKRAMGLKGPLVRRHRNAWVPAASVHEAVGQAVNYLVGLDEHRTRIRDELGIETRRASALVLIGHPAVQPEVPEEELNEALRTFNAHLSRVEVLTYKELLDNARRSLAGPDDRRRA
ncbi:Shedu anti-phage system protein SduA domain-containing protein [Streptomyces sp. CC224B]|uniref:Shedu anti-phage system protein SduA domain-containing protein n=1 Tax=Streptomyces sp. CC224B TaxID=3044571 RepID=UPI0024A9E456|nr:Shedu anti-phage system protein SduA domain-containing protein [Streptomyces sp. CC224B]